MAVSAEILIPDWLSARARDIMNHVRANAPLAGVKTTVTRYYHGNCDLLVMWGVGAMHMSEIRQKHKDTGRHVITLDIGYFPREKANGPVRFSIDEDFPIKFLDNTSTSRVRFDMTGVVLREDYRENGHIVLAGIGPKHHEYMRDVLDSWEVDKLKELKQRFPDKRILYRPKPRRDFVRLDCEMDDTSSIEDVLKGASLAVCCHSNVAVDAVIAGVPIEVDTNVAAWLAGKPYNAASRRDFLNRLSWWQWRPTEFKSAWAHLLNFV